MAAVLEEVDEAELINVALVRSSAGACLRGHLRTSARAVTLKLLKTDSCLSQMQEALAQGGVCVKRVLLPVGVYRSRFLTGLLWDWMPEGSLHSLLYETNLYPDLPLALRLRILLDVAEGLNILHAISLPHAALKTTNVLLDHQYRAKLCDWGCETLVDVRTRAPCFRDLAFLAPEVLLGNVPGVKSDVYSFGVLMWETLNRRPPYEGFDQLQNLVMCAQEGPWPGMTRNLLPLETPQSHALTQLMTRCWSVDPKQRPLAEECVLELRKVLETLDPGAECRAVHLIQTCKERALLSCKHTAAWALSIELNNLEGYGGCTGPKYLKSKTMAVTVPFSYKHNAQTRRSDEQSPRGSPPSPALAQASPMTRCCSGQRDVSSSFSHSAVRRCAGAWDVKQTRPSPPPNTPCGSPTSPTHTPLHPATQRTPSDTSSSCSSPAPEPMQTDPYRLSGYACTVEKMTTSSKPAQPVLHAQRFFFVARKDGGLRPCIHYRVLNSQMVKFAHPLPLVPAALEELHGAQIFSKLDLRSAYNLIRIRRGDEWKTAFITPSGHYEYLVMPYGLSNALSVFQSFMNEIFRDMLHRFVVVYIDDILIYSPNLSDHVDHVKQVLHRLRYYHFYLKLEKWEFHQSTTQFLGYIISPEGIQMDCAKVEAIKSWPQPGTVKDLQHFLGFANFYRRFISRYSDLTAPLTSRLCKKPKNVSCTSGTIEAFWKLKAAFCTAPTLIHADPTRPFVVEVDASALGKLSLVEQNHDIGNCELFFTRFNFCVTYRPVNKNTKADALSRIHSSDPMPEEPEPILPPDLFVCPITWSLDDDIGAATEEEPAPPGGPDGKVYAPTSLRLSLLDSLHASLGSGHPGRQRTLSLPKERYWWPNMAEYVACFVRGCSVCAMVSTLRHLPEGKLVPLPISHRHWSHLVINFATDLPVSNGFTTILVTVDCFSKACKLIPLKGLPTALETVKALFSNVFRHFGIPEDLVSDRGPQFISRVWRGFFKLLGVSVSLSSGYRAQTNGQTERKIQEIERYLRAYCHDHQHNWSQYLPWAEYVQNSLRQESTKLTPFQCILGYQPPLVPWSAELSERAGRRQKVQVDVRRRDAPLYHPGDKVWLSTRDIRLRLPCKMLSPRYIGPFTILRQINDVTYELQLPQPEIPSPPEIKTDDTIYQVREVVNSRRCGGRLQYLVDWEGYGPEERSWVDRDDILDPSLLVEFHQRHPGHPAPRGRGCPRRRSRASGDACGGGAMFPVSSGWTCCRLLQERREAIVQFMTEGRLNNLLDVLRAKRAVTREDYEFIMAAMTLSARTRCLLDTCACLGEKVAVLVATTLGLVSMETTQGHARSRTSPKGQVG
ncbi:hypothetical protein QTP86_030343 [Hemibagrus guttatus]|nr:hypothetical protein QTP86_030343 [Hemibagrus guttatus]